MRPLVRRIVANYSGGYDFRPGAPLLAQACLELVGAQRLFSTTAAADPNVREVNMAKLRLSDIGVRRQRRQH
jgi:hypothetical protein